MEKSMIVGVFAPDKPRHGITRIMEELALLTESAGGQVIDTFHQRRKGPDKRYLIGKGKAHEIKNAAYAKDVELIIFYNHLTNIQQRNLEKLFRLKVIDRTRLILDVFATRARSLEGKLQVELAQMLYLLPRLTGKGVELSRLGGGIGTRGPGETKLEADRRTIKKRISIIRNRLNKVIKNREVQRKGRQTNPIPVVSLVGYTSAGKSTLFKALTEENVTVSRMLFSTLDPILRRVDLNEIEEGYAFLLSDTVGFIREMPDELFHAFKATLEEMIQSDIILHIIDVSDPDYVSRQRDVQKVLEQMKIPAHKVLHVYNKIDLVPNFPDHHFGTGDESGTISETNEDDLETDKITDDITYDTTDDTPLPYSGLLNTEKRIYISAKEKKGLINLKKIIFDKYFSNYGRYHLRIPYGKMNPASVHSWAIVVSKNINDGFIEIDILCSRENMVKFKEKYGGYVT